MGKLFYDKLKASLDENNKYQGIENGINDKLKKLQNSMKNSKNWEELFLQRGNIFFGLIEKLVKYINTKNESNNEINWKNIPWVYTFIKCNNT